MEVTVLYRHIASRVVAVDTRFKVKLTGVECVQSKVEDFYITDSYDVIDIDPFGSCLVVLERVISTCRKAKAIVLTDGYAVKKRKHKNDVVATLKAGGFQVVGETINEQNTAIHMFAIKNSALRKKKAQHRGLSCLGASMEPSTPAKPHRYSS